jgi:hypothetical protein
LAINFVTRYDIEHMRRIEKHYGIEIKELLTADARLAGEASVLAGDLCAAQGMEADKAYTSGTRGGQYAAEIVFVALRKIGALPEQIDAEAFIAAANEAAEASSQVRLGKQ